MLTLQVLCRMLPSFWWATRPASLGNSVLNRRNLRHSSRPEKKLIQIPMWNWEIPRKRRFLKTRLLYVATSAFCSVPIGSTSHQLCFDHMGMNTLCSKNYSSDTSNPSAFLVEPVRFRGIFPLNHFQWPTLPWVLRRLTWWSKTLPRGRRLWMAVFFFFETHFATARHLL